ncbi:MAG: ABC transporter permease [Sphingomonadales bacterium]|nr:ABC transporter permease [Sphingomonadales bacterium]
MNKIPLVAGREFFTRIQSRTFIIMSLLGPLLFGLFILVPVLMAQWDNESTTVWIHDPSGNFDSAFANTDGMKFEKLPQGTLSKGQLNAKDSANIRELLQESETGVLSLQVLDSSWNTNIAYFSEQSAGLQITQHIEEAVNDRIYQLRMTQYGLDPQDIESLNTESDLKAYVWTEEGSQDSHTEMATMLGFGAALLMYMFIFLYGSMVMRGVIEEKAGRVMELLISTTSPFQLMMGKILGIASVGLFQFVLWILLGTGISTLVGALGLSENSPPSTTTGMTDSELPTTNPDWMQMLGSMPWESIIPLFLFYFLCGYFLYAALFAAVGSAVDSEGDSQQLVMPISMPIILAIITSQFVMQNPHGSLAFWMSMFPLTSPILMVVRLPFGVPFWEIALSISFLVAAFVGSVWIAGRIFRIGVLMYGQKVSLGLLRKWLFYR